MTPELVALETNASFGVFAAEKDAIYLQDCSITMLSPKEKSDNPHLQGTKVKYIYTSEKVIDRCGCGTSF